jgi:hypothetical protein
MREQVSTTLAWAACGKCWGLKYSW